MNRFQEFSLGLGYKRPTLAFFWQKLINTYNAPDPVVYGLARFSQKSLERFSHYDFNMYLVCAHVPSAVQPLIGEPVEIVFPSIFPPLYWFNMSEALTSSALTVYIGRRR